MSNDGELPDDKNEIRNQLKIESFFKKMNMQFFTIFR